MSQTTRGIKAAQAGLLVNIGLVALKLISGIVGHSYALIADALESSLDVFSSLIVWTGLRITMRPADEKYPYGYGKAEPLAAAVVSFLLIGAAFGIAVAAISEILTPHHLPAPFTLAIIPIVIVTKELLFRRVLKVGEEMGSRAVGADAWHHRSDAITSAAAFVGIGIAVWGGPGWEAADDWAALFASVIIARNGFVMLKSVTPDLMDRIPDPKIVTLIESTAASVPGVLAIEKLRVRRLGLEYVADLHMQADPNLSLRDAHILSGKLKSAIRAADPKITSVLIHIEPYEPKWN